MKNKPRVLVLYSGGRDSSATALEMARTGYDVTLFTYSDGNQELIGKHGDSAPDIRHAELMRVFPESIREERVRRGNVYLLRKLALEKTNKTHVVYPIVLILNVVADAILYCLQNDIQYIACGYSGYQGKEDRYIEQRKDYYELMKQFVGEYGITFLAPIIDCSKEDIVNILEKQGVSTNSLEDRSAFSGIPFDVDKALAFWNESIPICRDYIEFRK
jgi:7-cyano-7-deazaguanine synthase in queuosine biosynthesis